MKIYVPHTNFKDKIIISAFYKLQNTLKYKSKAFSSKYLTEWAILKNFKDGGEQI